MFDFYDNLGDLDNACVYRGAPILPFAYFVGKTRGYHDDGSLLGPNSYFRFWSYGQISRGAFCLAGLLPEQVGRPEALYAEPAVRET